MAAAVRGQRLLFRSGMEVIGLVDCRVVADRLYGIHLRRPGDVLAQKLTASPSRQRRLFHTREKWPEQQTLPLPGQRFYCSALFNRRR
jgi:hypothetical protein